MATLVLQAAPSFAQSLTRAAMLPQPGPPASETCTYHAHTIDAVKDEQTLALRRATLPWRPGEPGAPARTATIQVNYNGFTPAAQAAFQYAVDIWASILTSPVTIRVDATFADLGPSVLGSARSNFIFPLTDGVNVSWFGEALTDALLGTDQNLGSPDILANFNSDANWYFGLDGNPSFFQFDFVTVVLHELGHGLGFFGSAEQNNGFALDGNECNGVTGSGCWGRSGFPDIYDRFVEDAGGTPLIDTATYPINSTALGDLITGNSLFTDSALISSTSAGRPRLFAPSTYQPGSSYSHLDENTYTFGTDNALMTASLSNFEVVQTPGPIVCRMFAEFGWTVDLAACDALAIPVELTGFEALLDGTDVVLQWATASETNNSGFEVQLRTPDTTDFEVLDFVSGAGTTSEAQAYTFRIADLAPGTYTVRLRQLDFDGRFEILPEVEVAVEVVGTHWLTAAYPNPVRSEATVEFAVARSVPVRVEVYDVLGRPVQTLYDATPAADTPVRARLDATRLASGTYIVQVTGEGFRETQRVTVVR